jgi:hypothetical protein
MHIARSEHRHVRRRLLLAIATALAVSLPLAASAHGIESPPVPAALRVPAGNQAFVVAHAIGTQNYVCLPSGWTFLGPQATLFDRHDKQLMTHFLSANPDESATPRATWQHSRDTSAVWALAIASSTDPAYVEPGAIPWLLLRVVGAEDGPTGGDALTATTFIQRVDTSGGVAPATGCSAPADVGKRALVPYTTDYVFYKAGKTRPHDD